LDRKSVIYIDVDDTLIRTFGSKQIPIPRSADYVRRMHAEGHALYCWSRGGAHYSRDVATKLGIAEFFVGFLPKPDVVLDDQLEKFLEYCEFLHPNNV
jgi:cation transport ATPase